MQADWCRSGMANVKATVWDMPVYQYRLASGKLKRRACGLEFHRILREELLGQASVQTARAKGNLKLVVERPSPIPDMDGWQSAALSGEFISTLCISLHLYRYIFRIPVENLILNPLSCVRLCCYTPF